MSNFFENSDPLEALKALPVDELPNVADAIRKIIIETVSLNGGHLASSLGVVELTIALHRVFNSPEDKIVWDVGHQAYAHKLLTGRYSKFHTLRQLDGISGFPKRKESKHDCFDVGHSSTSISAALGMAAARDANRTDEKIVAIIGDGSLTAGLAFEALNQAGHLKKDMIVILNDNEMSISPNVGALSAFFSRQLTSDFFVRMKRETENFLDHVPKIGRDLRRFAKKAEEAVKGFLTPGMLFEAFGFDYVGPLKGHKIDELIEMLENVKRMDGPILVHVVTKKGKGYMPAEANPPVYHGVGPFDLVTGEVKKTKTDAPSYTKIFGDTLVDLAETDPRIVAVTAAMPDGTGLKRFAERFPDRFFDVGIAEQHAVTFAAGMATRGLKPVCAIYSTFLQRAYDNILHDVCLQDLPVTFALDRGGLVGADGPTHHGVFDHSYLRHIPNLVFMVPRDENQLRLAMKTAQNHEGPFAFRYPRGSACGVNISPMRPIPIGQAEKLREGGDGSIFAVGVTVKEALLAAEILAKEGFELAVIDPVYIKPLDRAMLKSEAENTGFVITVEENVLQGGFGSAVLESLASDRLTPQVMTIGLPDCFVEQGSQKELRARYGLDAQGIVQKVRETLVKN
ncbi:MAG: 1-deoxy-D-xylulose-5-phosphate synthase [Deltaproteobacteria bacterium]|jgi:1-deoxy-D-xylulose-5-phosphate synthase|nr:1-deoxy-D-xylulose-5-phosphate synthase [Deltaproteobacteria bacterium]